MSKRAQKLISLLLALSLLMGLSISASAEMDSRVRTRVEGVGLMEGYEDGSFGEDDELTRAQMCMIAARILQIETVGFGASPFSDVADDHWAKDVIASLSQTGVVNGMGDGTFLPDKSVSYFEAAKILVSVLGYSDFADAMGGYPNGYLAQASKLGLLKGVTAKDGAISRGEVAQMLDKALEVKPIGYNFMQNYPEASYTLQKILSDSKDLVQFKGTLTETAKSSLAATEPTLKEGVVLVAEQKLLCDMPMEEFLGCELLVYAYLDDAVDKYRIKSFSPTKNNVIYEADAENVDWNGDEVVLFDDDGNELEELTLASAGKLITLYNGRKTDARSEVVYGGYRFLDSNDDNIVDVLFIEEAQSFVIDKVNTKTQTIYFKDRATLNGRNTLVVDQEDDDKSISLVDAEGNEVSVSDLGADMAITVFASKDQKYVQAIVSSETVAGKVTGKSEEGIQIDDTFYELAMNPDGKAVYDPTLGEEATYLLDCYGKVVGNIGEIKSSYEYAYIIDAKTGQGLNAGLSIQTIAGQKPRKEVEIKAGEEYVSYLFMNDSIKVYDCASNCNYYFYDYVIGEVINEGDSAAEKERKEALNYYANTHVSSGIKTDADSVDKDDLVGKMAAFRLNSEGKIKDLYLIPTDQIGENYTFNADILSFGGENVPTRGYATDESTMFICVPESVTSDEDFYVQVEIKDDGAGNKVTGGVFFPETRYVSAIEEPADVILIKAKMNASTITPVLTSNKVCMVVEVLNTIGEDGEQVYTINLLSGDQELNVVTKSGSHAEDVARSLRKGDLIRYVKDGKDKVTNISKLVSVQGLGDNYSSNVYIASGVETGIYGLAYNSVPSVFDHFSNQIVDRLQLTYDANGENKSNVYRLFHDDMPTVYKYDRRGGWISPGNLDDIRSYNQVGEDADGILAIIENNDIKAFVIITDY